MVTERAKELLLEGGYTCVFMSEVQTLTSKKRGVAPLLNLIDEKKSLRGFCAADKVVGAGAAYLYVILEVKELFALTLSEPAKLILKQNGILCYYDNCVPNIINRAGDGVCPMEKAVARAKNPAEALMCIRKALAELK